MNVMPYKNILEKFNSGAVSIVADSWDVYHACKDLFGRHGYFH